MLQVLTPAPLPLSFTFILYKAYSNFQPKRLCIQLSRVAFLRFRDSIARSHWDLHTLLRVAVAAQLMCFHLTLSGCNREPAFLLKFEIVAL
jgi:hypothetical protein